MIVALDVAILRPTLLIVVQKRLPIAADIVGESRRHPESAVHERSRRRHRQRIDFGGTDRRRRVRLKKVLRVSRHAQAIRELDHMLDSGARSGAHRGRVARLAHRDSTADVSSVLRLRLGVEVLDLLDPTAAAERHGDWRIEHGAALEHVGHDLLDRLRRRLHGEHLLRETLDQRAIGEDLEGGSRLPPAARDHVVLQLLEVGISDLGEHVPREVDRERASTQLVVVGIW